MHKCHLSSRTRAACLAPYQKIVTMAADLIIELATTYFAPVFLRAVVYWDFIPLLIFNLTRAFWLSSIISSIPFNICRSIKILISEMQFRMQWLMKKDYSRFKTINTFILTGSTDLISAYLKLTLKYTLLYFQWVDLFPCRYVLPFQKTIRLLNFT